MSVSFRMMFSETKGGDGLLASTIASDDPSIHTQALPQTRQEAR